MKRHLKIFLTAALAITVFASAGCINGCGADYSNGERSGTITKFSNKGIWIKSWEGELIMAGATTNSQGAAVANIFAFTVADKDVVPRVQDAQRAGRPVTLVYRQWLQSPVGMESDYEIVAVK